MECGIVFREEPLMGRHTYDCGAARPKDSANLGYSFAVVLDMLENVGCHDDVEGALAKGELGSAGSAVYRASALVRQSDSR